MNTVLLVVSLIGLIIFVVAALIHLFSPKTTMGTLATWSLAVIGLVIWAIASIISLFIALF